MTGVLPGHRRGGVAAALKLRGVSHAREQGFDMLRAENDANNTAVGKLNDHMGFVQRDETVELLRPVQSN